ncbi:MAG: hypothetical protein IK109_08500, partial [Clostridiales bacterium]|nr:hypothetical protein [Clostridiales bacterium]
VGMWSESLERIFFAETESYDSQWRYDEDIRPSTAKAPAGKPAAQPAKKPAQTVSRPKTTKKKKNNKKKK